MADEHLRMIAELRDRASGPLRRLRQVFESTGRTDAFKKLQQDMTRTERVAYRFGFAMGRTIRLGAIAAAGATLAASAAMIKFGKDAADALDDISDMSKQIGWSADSLRTLQGVGKHFAVSQEAINSGLSKFNSSLGRLRQNQGAFYTYLQKTNPALAQQMKNAGSAQNAFILLSDAIAKTTDPAKRAALIKASGLTQEFLRFFADGPDELRRWITEVKRAQGTLGDQAFERVGALGDSLDQVGFAWRGLMDRLTVRAVPVIAPFINDLAESLIKNRDVISETFTSIARDIGNGMKAMGSWAMSKEGKDSLRAFWEDLKSIASTIGDVARAVNEVVKSFGGWKVVIGALIALKLKGWISGAIGGVGAMLPDRIKLPDSAKVPSGAGTANGGAGNGGGSSSGGRGFLPGLLLNGFLLGDLLKGIPSGKAEFDAWFQQNRKRSEGWNASLEKIIPRWLYSKDGWSGLGGLINPGGAVPSDSAPLEELQARLGRLNRVKSSMDEKLKRYLSDGFDKADPQAFAQFMKDRAEVYGEIADLADRIAKALEEAAKPIGKEIGKEGGKSFIDEIRRFFQQSSFGGVSGGLDGGGIIQASYRPPSGRGGVRRMSFGGGGGGFSGAPGSVPANMQAGADRAMALLMQNGFNPAQAAAIAGNLQQESSFNPNSLNRGEGAHGLMQWRGARWENLKRFAGSRGLNPNDWHAQIAFIREELTNPKYGEAGKTAARALLNARSVGEANAALKGFIRYGDRSIGTRRGNAEAILKRHQKSQTTGGKIEGSASVDVRFHNAPAGTKVAARGSGLFREVNLDTGRSMKPSFA